MANSNHHSTQCVGFVTSHVPNSHETKYSTLTFKGASPSAPWNVLNLDAVTYPCLHEPSFCE